MDKTKETIKGFLGKSGHHDTTVHEQVNAPVTHETVKPTTHEEVNTAVQKEVHQDHYHHAVQPVHDKEVLPEQHEHRAAGIQKREFDHRNHDETKAAVAAEAAKFHDKRDVTSTTHTQSAAPVVAGEHVHHHIHETIQPVIHKETVQPKVVHTTVPVHETHHLGAKHHGTTELPPVSMSEFNKEGGILGNGKTERFDRIDGEPRSMGETMKHVHQHGTTNPIKGALHGDYDESGKALHTGHSTTGTGVDHTTTGTGIGHHNNTAGPHNSNIANTADPRVDSDRDGSHALGQKTTAGPHSSNVGNKADPRVDSDLDGSRTATLGSAGANATHGHNTTSHSTTTGSHATGTGEKKHGGLLDKLNPKTDSDGDGKAGFLK